jgi:ankyrin repeat protein
LRQNQNHQELVTIPVIQTGAVISLLTRDDGVIVDAFDHAGYTALHVAAAAADSDAIAALCAAGARFDTQAANDEVESAEGFTLKKIIVVFVLMLLF